MTALFKASAHYWKNLIYYVRYEPTSQPVLGSVVLYHGFPGLFTKNHDIAEWLCLRGYQVFLPHSPGISFSKGSFAFDHAMTSLRRFTHWCRDEAHGKFSLIGMSFGGAIAIMLHEIADDQVCLLAPLTRVPLSGSLEQDVAIIHEMAPKNLLPDRPEVLSQHRTLGAEFSAKRQEFGRQDRLRRTIIHGRHDEVIPVNLSMSFVEEFPNVQLHLLDEDHRLGLHRPSLYEVLPFA